MEDQFTNNNKSGKVNIPLLVINGAKRKLVEAGALFVTPDIKK
jgi:hypothetical protein